MDSKKFRSLMVLNGDTNDSLADYLGITAASVSKKINENGSEFKQHEIARIKLRYKMTAEQVDSIFFNW